MTLTESERVAPLVALIVQLLVAHTIPVGHKASFNKLTSASLKIAFP